MCTQYHPPESSEPDPSPDETSDRAATEFEALFEFVIETLVEARQKLKGTQITITDRINQPAGLRQLESLADFIETAKADLRSVRGEINSAIELLIDVSSALRAKPDGKNPDAGAAHPDPD